MTDCHAAIAIHRPAAYNSDQHRAYAGEPWPATSLGDRYLLDPASVDAVIETVRLALPFVDVVSVEPHDDGIFAAAAETLGRVTGRLPCQPSK